MLKLDRLLLVSFILFSVHGFALVDMKNANFSHAWTDIELPGGTGYDLKVERTYNSRSNYSGIFGFGWCSDFETTLEKLPTGDLKVTQCGAGQEVIFKNKKKSDSSVVVYPSESSDSDFVRAENNSYTRNLPDGSLMKFSGAGKLTHLYDRNGNYLKIDYAKDQIVEVSDSLGHRFTFEYSPNKKVKRVAEVGSPDAAAAPKKKGAKPTLLVVDYQYKNLDDLISVKNAWGNTYTYTYDDLHNMTRANYPDNTFIALTYNKKMDWVTGFTDREKCVEKYDYQFDPKEPKLHYWATVKKSCGKEQFTDNRFEFWYKNRSGGEPYFAKLLTIENGLKTEIEYHPDFGKPTFIARGKNEFHFEYYASGQVKKKIADQFTLTFEYDPKIMKVSKVTSLINPPRQPGSKTKADPITKTAVFKYDQRSNLVNAENSDGQRVEMGYDKKGRIERLEDQAHKVVKLQYDDRTGKPSHVERPGLGSIKITYKPGGDIEKVFSPEGPTVATQVASIFNNLLDVIAPATAEIFN